MDLLVVVPVVVALVEGGKLTGLPSKYAFLASLVLSVALMVGFGEGEMKLRVLEGLIAGLSASGLYSGAYKPAREKLGL